MQTGIDILMKMVGLHAIRKKKGYSQLKVAMDLSISREAISYYENGLRCPNLEMLVKLSDYFNVSIDYLITGKKFRRIVKQIILQNKSPLGSKCQISQKCVDKSTER